MVGDLPNDSWGDSVNLRKKLTAGIFAGMLATSSALMTAAPASAYAYTGGKWSSSSIGVYMYPMSTKGTQSWTNARNNWTQATDVNFYAGAPGTNIALRETSNASVGWDGIAYTTTSGGYYQVPATGYLNTAYTNGYSYLTTTGVAAHELGHLVGLAHVNAAVLMNPTTPGRGSIYYVTTDEQAGVNRLY